MSVYEKLGKIQTNLKAPKNQFNSFGKYNYRSCEDILEGLKPLLTEYNCSVIISDEIELIGDRYYLKATATLIDNEKTDNNIISVSGYAREAESKKGMDDSQVSGATSSYARKYALNGLFAIDDTKDADSQDNRAKTPGKKVEPNNTNTNKATNNDLISDAQQKRMFAISKGETGIAAEILQQYGYQKSNEVKKSDYNKICDEIIRAVGA